MASNPIEQRIELLAEQWEKCKNTNSSIICFRCQADEVDMVDTFYTYMIAADTPIYDIAFHFDSICQDVRTFSAALLKELSEIIHTWNNSKKDERISYQEIDWKADEHFHSSKNPALLFVENFNNLAKKLDLDQSLNVVAIFKTHNKTPGFKEWLRFALKTGIDKHVKYLVDDTVNAPFFEEFKAYKKEVLFLPVNLDMAGAMEQAAAMGDPKDPATGYRFSFIKMMNAMGQSKEKEAEQAGHTCLKIAEENLDKDPYWSTQLVTVYITLATDKIKYKKMTEALELANKAVETSILLQGYIDNSMATILQAQSQMFRGTIFFTTKKYQEAFNDYTDAFGVYTKQGQLALAIESARMGAESANKLGNKNEERACIVKGIQLGKQLDELTAMASTYAALLKMYVEEYDQLYELQLSKKEVETLAKTLYGSDWLQKIKSWNNVTKPPAKENLVSDNSN